MQLVRKTTTQSKTDDALLFTWTSRAVDSYDDLVLPEGVDFENFIKTNPICLLNHIPADPIGIWEQPYFSDGKLCAHLRLAPEGTSTKSDEARKLIACGILRGCSIGFHPIESSPRPGSKKGGLLYSKVRIVEVSVVSIPANPEALLQAKSMGVSASTLKSLFRQGQNATLAERIARAKAVTRRAKMLLAKSPSSTRSKTKVPLLTMSEQTKAKYDRARTATARAKAILAKGAVDAMQPPFEKLNKAPIEGSTWQGKNVALTWRGVPIPTSKWRGEK